MIFLLFENSVFASYIIISYKKFLILNTVNKPQAVLSIKYLTEDRLMVKNLSFKPAVKLQVPFSYKLRPRQQTKT